MSRVGASRHPCKEGHITSEVLLLRLPKRRRRTYCCRFHFVHVLEPERTDSFPWGLTSVIARDSTGHVLVPLLRSRVHRFPSMSHASLERERRHCPPKTQRGVSGAQVLLPRSSTQVSPTYHEPASGRWERPRSVHLDLSRAISRRQPSACALSRATHAAPHQSSETECVGVRQCWKSWLSDRHSSHGGSGAICAS